MLLIGLVGGIASGKSLVAEQMRALGAVVLSGDQAGHEVLCERGVPETLRGRWGDSIFAADGSIDRSAVARLVFAPGKEKERRFLESVTHPRIAAKLREQIAAAKQQGASVAVLDAALLFEAGWDRLCDVVLFVSAPRNIRLARALSRGWKESDFLTREAAQLPLDEKRAHSGYSIDNSGPPDQTRQQVSEFWRLNVERTDH